MNDELKPCPFCGVHYFIYEIDDDYYCSKCLVKVPKEIYNTRPLEDALRAKLDTLAQVEEKAEGGANG